VPDSVKEGLDIVYVDDVREVLKIVFKDRAPDLVARLDTLPLVPLEEPQSQ
jgi:ATP-dependent Lon protease